MKTNVMDLVTDMLKERMNTAIGEVSAQFKGSNPYRQRIITPKEKLLTYDSITPDMHPALRESLGTDTYDKYVNEMETLKKRYQGGNYGRTT